MSVARAHNVTEFTYSKTTGTRMTRRHAPVIRANEDALASTVGRTIVELVVIAFIATILIMGAELRDFSRR
jgi:hypothetical protein